jgi:UDP-glucose 4-epimerase
MKILLTGGAGFIGLHTAVDLLQSGHEIVAVDNLSNSSRESLRRVQEITGKAAPLVTQDICDESALDALFQEHTFDAVIHFAGLKSVSESIAQPLHYYRNNIDSTLALCKVMQKHGVKKLVFSSSATVYGTSEDFPLKESSQVGVGITNPYGQTKFMIEQILRDLAVADPTWEITILRYFNPIGAHESGLIGENPNGIPNNLLPYVAQVAVGKLKYVHVYGDDYDTPDGTGVRDYIHVVDLAKGHVAAVNHSHTGVRTYNLGTGKGVSVLEIIHAFEKAAGKEIPYRIEARRPGDIATSYADASLAAAELGWRTEHTIEDACRDAWNWQSHNPNGYDKEES